MRTPNEDAEGLLDADAAGALYEVKVGHLGLPIRGHHLLARVVGAVAVGEVGGGEQVHHQAQLRQSKDLRVLRGRRHVEAPKEEAQLRAARRRGEGRVVGAQVRGGLARVLLVEVGAVDGRRLVSRVVRQG